MEDVKGPLGVAKDDLDEGVEHLLATLVREVRLAVQKAFDAGDDPGGAVEGDVLRVEAVYVCDAVSSTCLAPRSVRLTLLEQRIAVVIQRLAVEIRQILPDLRQVRITSSRTSAIRATLAQRTRKTW